MHPQIQSIGDEFKAAQRRLHHLREIVPAARWGERPRPAAWSVGECVAHLNLTTEGFRPAVERALAEGRARKEVPPSRYRRDPLGWFLWRIMEPPVRVRVKTVPPFVPAANRPAEELVEEFDRLQQEQVDWLDRADGLPLSRLWIHSPFNARVKYNLFSCLSILPRHQQRHIWQAEQAWAAIGVD